MYKAVSVIDDKLKSFNHPLGEYSVEYKKNEWAYPEVGYLFVFDTLENLQRFLNSTCWIGSIQTWECEIDEIHIVPVMLGYYTSQNLKRFWYNKLYKNNLLDYKPIPLGTLMTNKVKLTKQVID